VNGVVVLLVNGANQLEVTNAVTLDLLGTEEADGSLGWLSRALRDFACGDENETVALGLPSEVDNCVFDTVDDLNGDTLLANAEDFEVGGHALLALAVPVDLDAEEVGVGLPVKLGVGDVEQVPGTDDLLGGDSHKTDLGRVAAHLRSPVAEQLLVGLDVGSLGVGGAPLEVHDAFNLDAGLVHKVHTRQLVDADTLAGVHACNVLGVGRPLESGPL
jgi:hypothetical protein